MPKKKPPNWEDIKTRYVVHGEKPHDIAQIYDVSPRSITQRAWREKWKATQAVVGEMVRAEAIITKKELTTLAYEGYGYAIKQLVDLFKAEGSLSKKAFINPLFSEPNKLMLRLIDESDGNGTEEKDKPGFIIKIDPA